MCIKKTFIFVCALYSAKHDIFIKNSCYFTNIVNVLLEDNKVERQDTVIMETMEIMETMLHAILEIKTNGKF